MQANVGAWYDAFFGENPPPEYIGGLETWACSSDRMAYSHANDYDIALCNDAMAQLSSGLAIVAIGVGTPIPGDGAIGLGIVYKTSANGIQVLYKIIAVGTAYYTGVYVADVLGEDWARNMFAAYSATYTAATAIDYFASEMVMETSFRDSSHHPANGTEAYEVMTAIYATFAIASTTPPICKTVKTILQTGVEVTAMVVMNAPGAKAGHYALMWQDSTGRWSAYWKDTPRFDEAVQKVLRGEPISPGQFGKDRTISDGCPPGFPPPGLIPG